METFLYIIFGIVIGIYIGWKSHNWHPRNRCYILPSCSYLADRKMLEKVIDINNN